MSQNYEQMMLGEFEKQKKWLAEKDLEEIFTSFLLNGLKMKSIDVDHKVPEECSVTPFLDEAKSMKKMIDEFGKEEDWLAQKALGWKQKLEGIWGKCFDRSYLKYIDYSEEDQKKLMNRKGRLLLGGSEILTFSSSLVAGDELRHFALTVAMKHFIPHCYQSLMYVFAKWSESDDQRENIIKETWNSFSLPTDLEDLFLQKLSLRIHAILEYKQKKRFDNSLKLRSIMFEREVKKQLQDPISKGDLWEVARAALGYTMSLHVREIPSEDVKIKKLQLNFKLPNSTETCPLLTVYYSPLTNKSFRLNDIVSIVFMRVFFEKYYGWFVQNFNFEVLKFSTNGNIVNSDKSQQGDSTQNKLQEDRLNTELTPAHAEPSTTLQSPQELPCPPYVDHTPLIQHEVIQFHNSILTDLYKMMHPGADSYQPDVTGEEMTEWLHELTSRLGKRSTSESSREEALEPTCNK